MPTQTVTTFAEVEARTGEHLKWTARIEIDGDEIEATPSRLLQAGLGGDTLRDTSKAAEDEAAEYLRAGLATEARVVLYKRLKNDPAPVRDRMTAYLYVEAGRVYVQRLS